MNCSASFKVKKCPAFSDVKYEDFHHSTEKFLCRNTNEHLKYSKTALGKKPLAAAQEKPIYIKAP